jgi:hypothetical protein
MTRTALDKALTTEHEALVDAEMDDCNVLPRNDQMLNYFERHYVANYTTHIFENLRFYTRKKGKRAGRTIAIYVNPKTGKATKGPLQKYLDNANGKGDSLLSLINKADHLNPFEREHLKTHIVAKLKKNQRETITRLRKEKEKR